MNIKVKCVCLFLICMLCCPAVIISNSIHDDISLPDNEINANESDLSIDEVESLTNVSPTTLPSQDEKAPPIESGDEFSVSSFDELDDFVESVSTDQDGFGCDQERLTIGDDFLCYEYEAIPDENAIPYEGNLIPGINQDGSLRVVKDVTITGNLVNVSTYDMCLNQSQEVDTMDLSPTDIYYGSNINLVTIDFTDTQEFTTDDGKSIKVTYRTFIRESLLLEANVGCSGLESARIIFYTDVEMSFKVEIEDVKETTVTIPIYETKPKMWAGMILGCPCWMASFAEMKMGVSSNAHATIGLNVQAHKAFGLEYFDETWSVYDAGVMTVSPLSVDAGYEIEAKVSLPFGVRTYMAYVAGPYVGLEPYARYLLSIDASGDDAGIFVGIKGIAGFRFDFFNAMLVDYRISRTLVEYSAYTRQMYKRPTAPVLISQQTDCTQSSPKVLLDFVNDPRDYVSELDYYEIRRGIPDGTPVVVEIIPITTTSLINWVDTDVSWGSEYEYQIILHAKNGFESSPTGVFVSIPSISIVVGDPAGIDFDMPEVESGLKYKLTWTMPIPDSGNSVRIALIGDGTEYTIINSVDTGSASGSYDWYVDSSLFPYGGPYRIKIVSIEHAEITGQSPTAFSIVNRPRTITVTQPYAGERYVDDQILHIRWDWTGTIPYVNVRLKSDAQGFLGGIAINIPNTGELDYNLNHYLNFMSIPNELLFGGDDFQVIVYDYSSSSIYGESKEFYMVETIAPFEIISPNANDRLSIGESVTFTWASNVQASYLELRVYDGYSDWSIDDSIPNTGSYTFWVDSSNMFIGYDPGRICRFYIGYRIDGQMWAGMSEPIVVASLGDSYEIDDTISDSKRILPSSPQSHNLKNFQPDNDWVYFDIDTTSNVTLQTYGSGVDTHLWLYYEDSGSYIPLAENDDSAIENKSSLLVYQGLLPGRYYALVCEGADGPYDGTYYLSLEVESLEISRLQLASPTQGDNVKIGAPFEIEWISSDYPEGNIELSLQQYQGFSAGPWFWGRGPNTYGYCCGVTTYGDYVYVVCEYTSNNYCSLVTLRQSDLSVVNSRSYSIGTSEYEIGRPKGMAADENYLYLCDEACRLIRFDKNLNWVDVMGSQGTGAYQFISPYAVEVTSDRIYVADGYGGRYVSIDKTDMTWIADTEYDSSRGTLSGIAVVGDNIYGTYSNGELSILDKDSLTPLAYKNLGYGELKSLTADNEAMFAITSNLIIEIDLKTLEVVGTYDGTGFYGTDFPDKFQGLSDVTHTSDHLYVADINFASLDKITRPCYINIETITTSTQNDLSHIWVPDSELSTGSYSILATLNDGSGAYSRSAEFNLVQVPGQVLDLSVDSALGNIAINWQENVSDVCEKTYYVIYRNSTFGGWDEIFRGGSDSRSYNDVNPCPGSRYTYRVAAGNTYGDGILSEIYGYTVPSKVNGLDATCDIHTGHIHLSWSSSCVIGMATTYGIVRNSETIAQTESVSFVDEGVVMGSQYSYSIRATNTVGAGETSESSSITAQSIPSAPQNLEISPGDGQITLTWEPPSTDGGAEITSYTVYMGSTSGGGTPLATIGNVLTYTDIGLTNGDTYYYRISAINSVGEGRLSNEVYSTPESDDTVPSAPQNLEVSLEASTISLTWGAPVDNGGSIITGYNIYRGTSSGQLQLYTNVLNILTYNDINITNGQTYYYTVGAVNYVGEGPQSNEVSITLIECPSAPQNLQATPGDSQVTLTWSAPSSDGESTITGYKVHRSTSSGSETYLATTTSLSYVSTGLMNGQTYYYVVSAVNSVGESSSSNEVSATPEPSATAPSAPLSLQATPDDSQVTLTWSAPSSDGGSPITGYIVYRGNSSTYQVYLTTTSQLTYVDTGLINGQIYYYSVSAMNSVDEGPTSDWVPTTPFGDFMIPSVPLNLTAVSADSQVNLTWDEPEDDGGSMITNYLVYRGESSNTLLLHATMGNVLTFVDGDVINGATYHYAVSAMNSEGESPLSNGVSVTPMTSSSAPSAPTDLVATSGDSQITISWSAPSLDGGSTIICYKVYRDESYLTTTTYLSYVDTSVNSGQTYLYRISAMNSEGESPMSSEVSATLPLPLTVPSPPQALQATAGDSQVTLSWSTPSCDGGCPIICYRICRGTSSGMESYLTTTTELSYVDSGLESGQTYYYTVEATNSEGNSLTSNEASATLFEESSSSSPIGQFDSEQLMFIGIILAVVVVLSAVVISGRRKRT